MINLILEVSKYMMIFLMAIYTWANFRYFSFSDEERKQSICGRQNRVMFLLHFLAYLTLCLKSDSQEITAALAGFYADGNTDDLIDGIAGGLQHCGQCLCWKHEGGK